jgi:enolase-phosphatase E1
MRPQIPISALLLDIEGTTTPVDFVYKTLFLFARDHVGEYLEQHGASAEVQADLEALRSECSADRAQGLNPPEWSDQSASFLLEPAIAYIQWLIDRDRKSTPLKSLQGRIWKAGYESGELRGEVYPDVPRAFERWQAQGITIAIFSSGSALAQKLLFAKTVRGDLTPFIKAYFDTTAGPKKEPESYRSIVKALAVEPARVLFVSDVIAELEAARAAGLETLLCVRPGSAAPPESQHPAIRSFDEISP